MLILKPKWSWIWTPPSLSVLLGCFKRTLTLFTPHWPRTIQDASSPHNSRTTHAKINDYQLFSSTCLDLYTHAAPMPKHFTHWKHQQMRWETVYIDQIVSKAEAQGLQHYTTDGNVQRFYSCAFKLWDKIKILIVAFLQTYFILNVLLPCSSVSSLICPSESCVALVVHDLASPCFWAHAGGLLHVDGSYQMNAPFQVLKPLFTVFLVGNENWCFQCVEGFTSLIHPGNTPHVTFFFFLLLNLSAFRISKCNCFLILFYFHCFCEIEMSVDTILNILVWCWHDLSVPRCHLLLACW